MKLKKKFNIKELSNNFLFPCVTIDSKIEAGWVNDQGPPQRNSKHPGHTDKNGKRKRNITSQEKKDNSNNDEINEGNTSGLKKSPM